jgi:hypothetical protein
MGAKMGAAKGQIRPEMKELVREATTALARLDAERLEELARCCQALNRDWKKRPEARDKAEWARQAQEATGEFAVFTRVLEATRTNLKVMTRLRAFRREELEYGRQGRASQWAGPEASDGHN